MPAPPKEPKKAFVPWQRALQDVIDKNNPLKQNRKRVASNATMEARAYILFAGFRDLHTLGYQLHDPHSFKPKHMEALAKYWEEKKLSSATIQGRISTFRVFSEWVGKPGMIQSSEKYVVDKQSVTRSCIADHDKSWSANANVDFDKILEKVKQESVYVAMQLEMICAFGLRRKEAVMFHPHRADKGLYIVVNDGTKNSRDRIVPVDNEYKREVLDRAKTFAKTPNAHIGDPERSLFANIKKYENVMSKLGLTKKDLGVTGHGLRAQYMSDKYEEITGKKTPVRGGLPGEVDAETDLKARQQIIEEVGHSDIHTSAAYYGSHPNQKKQRQSIADL